MYDTVCGNVVGDGVGSTGEDASLTGKDETAGSISAGKDVDLTGKDTDTTGKDADLTSEDIGLIGKNVGSTGKDDVLLDGSIGKKNDLTIEDAGSTGEDTCSTATSILLNSIVSAIIIKLLQKNKTRIINVCMYVLVCKNYIQIILLDRYIWQDFCLRQLSISAASEVVSMAALSSI